MFTGMHTTNNAPHNWQSFHSGQHSHCVTCAVLHKVLINSLKNSWSKYCERHVQQHHCTVHASDSDEPFVQSLWQSHFDFHLSYDLCFCNDARVPFNYMFVVMTMMHFIFCKLRFSLGHVHPLGLSFCTLWIQYSSCSSSHSSQGKLGPNLGSSQASLY